MMNDFLMSKGWLKSFDQNGEAVYSRKPVGITYPCSSCGHPRAESISECLSLITILPCQMSSCSKE